MNTIERFVREYLKTDRELTALDYFGVMTQISPAEREALLLMYHAERLREKFADAKPFDLYA